MATEPADSDFATFYRLQKDPIYRAVLLATRQPERAEDAVAEAFTKAYGNWARVSRHPAPAAWVIRSALNSFRSGWRVWRLPARQREVVALRLLADLDTRQTAAVLGIAPKTVTVHLHRAVGRLRAGLEGSAYEEYA